MAGGLGSHGVTQLAPSAFWHLLLGARFSLTDPPIQLEGHLSPRVEEVSNDWKQGLQLIKLHLYVFQFSMKLTMPLLRGPPCHHSTAG